MTPKKRLKKLIQHARSLELEAEAVELERLVGDKFWIDGDRERAGRWGERCRGRLEAIRLRQQAIATEIAELQAQPDAAMESREETFAA